MRGIDLLPECFVAQFIEGHKFGLDGSGRVGHLGRTANFEDTEENGIKGLLGCLGGGEELVIEPIGNLEGEGLGHGRGTGVDGGGLEGVLLF